MKYKPYQCPYEDISCDQLNQATLTLDCGSCTECEHYNNGIHFSKGINYLNWKIFIIVLLLSLLIAFLTSCNNEPISLVRLNNNQGKVVHDLIPIPSKIRYDDTIGYKYVLIDPKTRKYSETRISKEYHYYSIGDTLP